ncbi:MAG: hypothetical protein EZS28_042679, partial [Streblomastix strix]
MYNQNWYYSGDIVPDQITHAYDATPLADSGTGVAGTSNENSRGDHQHPLQVFTVLTSKDTSDGTNRQASTYARSDHQHPIQTEDTIPVSDSAEVSYGTVDYYARNDHSHLINVQTNASIVPVINSVRNKGTSAYYSRHYHIHPKQLTYIGNTVALKFIKTEGLASEVYRKNKFSIDFPCICLATRIAQSDGGIDPNIIGLACQQTLAPSLQNPPSVPTLLTPQNIGVPAEQLTDPLVAPLFAPTPSTNSPAGVFTMLHQFFNVPLVEFKFHPRKITLQLLT